MKKLLSLIAVAAFAISTAFAQTPAAVTKQTAKNVNAVKATAPAVKKEAKKVETKTMAAKTAANNSTKKAPKNAVAKATKLKADGTPDMRYAENKAKTAVAPGPKKKDGTADMRYKANKAAAKKN